MVVSSGSLATSLSINLHVAEVELPVTLPVIAIMSIGAHFPYGTLLILFPVK